MATVCGLMVVAVVLAGCSNKPDPTCELLSWDGYEITITMLDGSMETRQVYPSEEGLDADGDKEDDCAEFVNGTDPNDADSAGDGLLDGSDVVLEPGDPRVERWTDQGIVHEELEDGRLVFRGSFTYELDPTMQDTIGSGILDGEKVGGFDVWMLGESQRFTTDPHRRDTSGDGLDDGFKRSLGLDPTQRDTDGDGFSDTEDVNPWVNFSYRLEVESLNLTNDPHDRSQRAMWLVLKHPQQRYQSPPVDVKEGEPVDGAKFSSNALDVRDSGGMLRQGEHNATFWIGARSTQDGKEIALDLFSHTMGDLILWGAIHGLTGELVWTEGDQGAHHEWPSSATFEGEHGNVTLRVVPVWPEPWQECIDDGCRHGDGDFPWR